MAACGGSNDDSSLAVQPPAQPKVTVEDLPAGSYAVSMGDVNAPMVGKYYAAADGSRLLVVADATDHANQLYRRAAGEPWVAVPASTTDVSVTFLRSGAVPAAAPALASLAGNYVTLAAAGTVANFSVNASGDIIAGASACKLAGKIAANGLLGTMKVTLATADCGSLPANSTGVATFDSDYMPAKFRLVVDNGTQPVDLWAYAN